MSSDPGIPRRWSSRWAGLALFVAFVALYGAGQRLVDGRGLHGDGRYIFYFARSLAFDGDLDLRNEYARCGDPWNLTRGWDPALRPPNPWGVGAAVVWTPLLLLGRPFAPPPPGDVLPGCAGPLVSFALFGSALAAAGAVALTFAFARRHAGGTAAALAAATVGLATPLLFYAVDAPVYAHAPAALAVALFLERWDATRAALAWRWPLLGALLGLAALIRAHDAVALAVLPAADMLRGFVARLRGPSPDAANAPAAPDAAGAPAPPDAAGAPAAPRARPTGRQVARAAGVTLAAGAAVAVGALVVFLPQMLVWKATYRHALVLPQGPHFMRWTQPALEGVLVSMSGGVLAWNPALYLAVAGLVGGAVSRARRSVALPVALVVVVGTYLNAAAWDWTGSGGFPNRRFTDLMPAFGLGLAFMGARALAFAAARPRAFATVALALGVGGFALFTQVVRLGGGYFGLADAAAWHHARGLDRLVWAVWWRVGNPLSWPGSLPFALRHGAHPRQYDFMRGRPLFDREYEALRAQTAPLSLDEPRAVHHLAGGFGTSPLAAGDRRGAPLFEPTGRLLLPAAAADFGSVELDVTAVDAPVPVEVRLNGHPLGKVRAPRGWATFALAVPAGVGRAGVNALTLVREGAGGLILGRVAFEELPPPPAFPSFIDGSSPARR